MESNSIKWYSNTNWIIFFLLVFPPLGIVFLWLKNNFLQIEKIGLTIAAAAVFIASILFPQSSSDYLMGAKLVFKVAIAFALILYGLRLFKIYIRIWGAVIGFLLGYVFGIALEINPLITAIIFLFIGGFVAWYVQKVIVFISVGLFLAFITIIICTIADINPWALAFFAFLTGGIVALVLYEYFVILSFSLPAALSIFHIAFSGQSGLADFYWNANNLFGTFTRLFQTLAEFYKTYWPSMSLILIMFAIFSIYYQKFLRIKEGDPESEQISKRIFKKMSAIFFVIIIFRLGFSVEVRNSFLRFSNIVGTISFPVVVFFSALIFEKLFYRKDFSILNQYLLALLFGIVIIPIVSTLTVSIVTFRVSNFINLLTGDTLYLWTFIVFKEYGIAVQYLMFCFIIFPICLLYLNRYLKTNFPRVVTT